MRLPAELCKPQRKKREIDGFSKSTWMTPPGSHPTSGFGARHGLPKFFRHKKRRIVQNDAAKTKISPVDIPTGRDPRTKQQRWVALADFSVAPWQGFEKSERGPNSSSLFQPLAAVVAVALGELGVHRWACAARHAMLEQGSIISFLIICKGIAYFSPFRCLVKHLSFSIHESTFQPVLL